MKRQLPASIDPAPPLVLCFGEILWDLLPEGQFPGGAPFNVAYHLHGQGLQPHLISAVGNDAHGRDLLARLGHWGVKTTGIGRVAKRPTGVVRALLGVSGNASYYIAPDVAWDYIKINGASIRAARKARALVFGSLAQRSVSNRRALEQLLALLPPEAERIFDVNLRPPHDDLALVRKLATQATLLKLNVDEAARLLQHDGDEERLAHALAAATGCRAICLTAGARGAGFLTKGKWRWEPGRPVAVADTVGAGDAFLAGFLAGHLCGRPTKECLARACRLGEWVASQPGATPPYPANERFKPGSPRSPGRTGTAVRNQSR